MTHAWSAYDPSYADVGYADEMDLMADNDEVLKDVILGNGAEGSGWNAHNHKTGTTWGPTQGNMGLEVHEALKDFRGGMLLRQFDQGISSHGGSYDSGAFPISTYADRDNTPGTMVRGDFTAGETGVQDSDFSIGHDNVTDPTGDYGYYWELQYQGDYKWHTVVFNWYRRVTSTNYFIGHVLTTDH